METEQKYWTAAHVLLDLCDPEDVGEPIPADAISEPQAELPADPEAPFIPSDAVLELAKARGVPLDDGDAIFGLAFELDPSGAMKKFPTVYLDWNRQKRLLRDSKTAQAARLADMTATKLKALPTKDILIKIVDGVFEEADDVRDRILARMGIDAAGLMELIDEEA
jgi:hypothetical protein